MINNVIGNRQLRQAVKAHFQRNDMFAMYYTLHQGAAVGTSTVNIPCAYGIGPTLQSSTISGGVISANADTAQWTAKNGYWVGNQTDRVLLGNYQTELEWDTKLAVRDGAVLVCCQVEKIANPASANAIWALGLARSPRTGQGSRRTSLASVDGSSGECGAACVLGQRPACRVADGTDAASLADDLV